MNRATRSLAMTQPSGIDLRVRRLTAADLDTARQMLRMMGRVFGETPAGLPDPYLEYLLRRTDFWALAAMEDAEVVGGLTAHVLPLTTRASAELFIYDLAVRHDRQRQGIGRRLIGTVREEAAAVGIGLVFVAADEEDLHALEFYRALGGRASPATVFTFSRRSS